MLKPTFATASRVLLCMYLHLIVFIKITNKSSISALINMYSIMQCWKQTVCQEIGLYARQKKNRLRWINSVTKQLGTTMFSLCDHISKMVTMEAHLNFSRISTKQRLCFIISIITWHVHDRRTTSNKCKSRATGWITSKQKLRQQKNLLIHWTSNVLVSSILCWSWTSGPITYVDRC